MEDVMRNVPLLDAGGCEVVMTHSTEKISLAQAIAAVPLPQGQPCVWTTRQVVTWSEMASLYQAAEHQLLSRVLPSATGPRQIGLAVQASASALAALAACQQLALDVYLLDGDWTKERLVDIAQQLQLEEVYSPESKQFLNRPDELPVADSRCDASLSPSVRGSVTILTSGTTGGMKAVRHQWERLTRPVRFLKNGSDQRWLLAYRPHLYAGLQVVLQAFLNGGTLVAPMPGDEPTQIARLMAEAGVQFASATPSYWRRLLLWADPRWFDRVTLRQITLGGEAIDQEILDRLHHVFPTARLVHIYATTELGRCFSVTDGRAGFPSHYLDAPSADGIELQIRDDQLWVRSANAMSGYASASTDLSLARADEAGWFPTGDLVALHGDRVHFVGRMSDMLNVGGNKVHPLVVERAIRQIAGVEDVRVFGQTSSIAGQLVACQIVAQTGVSPDHLRQQILAHCRERLDRYQCPRVIEFVDRLELTTAGKVARRP